MPAKRGHHYSDDLNANPMESPVRCQDEAPANAPKTPPSPSVGFSDPPKSTSAGKPTVPEEPDNEAGESPAYEKKEEDSGIY